MTSDPVTRADRVLSGLLVELADAHTPDYLEAAVEHASTQPQRPAWTFPERWIPMELTSTRAGTPRVPWRAIGVLALIGFLLAAISAYYVGTQRRLPAPFGPAANGVIAYSLDGDIYLGDAGGSMVRQLTSGASTDTDPLFSPNGGHVAFLRAAGTGFDLVVVPVDGGQARVISTAPLAAEDVVEWAPDSRWLLVGTADGRLTRLDANGDAAAMLIASDALLSPASSAFRPPEGTQIMFVRESDGGLMVMDQDGADPRLVLDNPGPGNRDFRYARWSPDGSMIAFTGTIGDGEQYRTFLVEADGSGLRRLSTAAGVFVEQDLRWSPDGRRIAFNHWQKDGDSEAWVIRPTGVIDVATGSMVDLGSAGSPDGTLFEWSPDGSSIIGVPGTLAPHGGTTIGAATITDATTGVSTELPWQVRSATSWQRLALPD